MNTSRLWTIVCPITQKPAGKVSIPVDAFLAKLEEACETIFKKTNGPMNVIFDGKRNRISVPANALTSDVLKNQKVPPIHWDNSRYLVPLNLDISA